ncbi:flagellar basal body-associated protein FliL [Pseudoruegeria sp. SK021]|uniref:flagellar basal body-associated FliL family protein n=1 Tax=Pseudoruegeria sp. SK021 TaxID=1933035 RepID=UPI000A247B42|nr:flagellar basal body-associated FliL family protein [Pseudoruegeria sp. SK021]OSP56805.1 flagellar basal body protein FliL [Pseudoruegeria sp. SK021]
MADDETPPSKKSRLPLILGAVMALVLGGGGFFAVYTGLVLGVSPVSDHAEAAVSHPDALEPVAFVPIAPLMVSVSRSTPEQFLRFEGTLEVDPAYAADVEVMMPRIMDVMNSYLRAVEVRDLRDPSALLVLRAQLLRRVQIVTGEGRVRDLLVTTFLVS